MNHDPEPHPEGWVKNPDYDKAEGRVLGCEPDAYTAIKLGPPPTPQRLREWFHFWKNFPSFPQRMAARWLRRKGWVCFYLRDEYRHCGIVKEGADPGGCWLKLYQDHERTK